MQNSSCRSAAVLSGMLLSGLCFAPAAHAQFTTYTDEALFQAVTGINDGIEFEEVDPRGADGTPPGFAPISDTNGSFQRNVLFQVLPGDTSQSAHGIANANDGDFYQTAFGTAYNLGSGDFVSVFAPDHTTPVTLNMIFSVSEFNTPYVYSVGFRLGDFDGNGALKVTATDINGLTSVLTVNHPQPTYGFVGFSSEQVISKIEVLGDTGNATPGFTFDHVLYSESPVPAPSSFLSLSLGLLPGAAWVLRRRKR